MEKHIIEEHFVRIVNSVGSRSFGDGMADDDDDRSRKLNRRYARNSRVPVAYDRADERDFPRETKANGDDAINIPEASGMMADEHTRLNFDPK